MSSLLSSYLGPYIILAREKEKIVIQKRMECPLCKHPNDKIHLLDTKDVKFCINCGQKLCNFELEISDYPDIDAFELFKDALMKVPFGENPASLEKKHIILLPNTKKTQSAPKILF